ncbi:thiamine-phosphate kinase [Bauldia litoralis]|uniref:Thiamine-monophosphate kinase n=1 Tax=Bauldia litoralis TaxID=665467 RepID=A0A1G6B1P4_9HYPH|nr:thiamine-phosphate kinase [Bauldia litoralis]SDB14587.1 thiamine-phosphate kinase [Bauldia litoralis]
MAERPGEFELIERYFRPLASDPGAFGLTDDVAVYVPPPGEDLVLKADQIVAGVHFFAGDPPSAIASKGLRVNLSDLASKGATPVGYLLSMALPDDWNEDWLRDFSAGLAADQALFGVSLFGGDTTRAAGGLTVSIAAFGRVPAGSVIRRAGAAPGDVVFVSGTIGDSALGLRIRLGTLDSMPAGKAADHLLDRYLLPQPRLALAPVLLRFATSSLDVSDGLVGDFAHICRASGVGGEIDADAVPLSAGARALVDSDKSALASVLAGGDDYEILSTVPEADAERFAAEAAEAGVPVTRIGRVVEGKAPPVVLGVNGQPLSLDAASHVHF